MANKFRVPEGSKRELTKLPGEALQTLGEMDWGQLPVTTTAASVSPLFAPKIWTDLDDYAPGSTAVITMTGLEEGATVRFEVDHVEDPGADGIWGTRDDVTYQLGGEGHDPWYVTDGGAGDFDGKVNGQIITTWHVNADDSLDERFLLTGDSVDAGADGIFGTADDVDTGIAASNTFTDSGGDYSIDFSVGDPSQYARRRPSDFDSVPSGRAPDPIPGASDTTANESLSPKELALGQVVPFEVEITTGSSATFTGTMEFTVSFGTETSNGTQFGYDESFGLFAAFVDGADAATTDPGSTVSNFTWTYDAVNGAIVATITVSNLSQNTSTIVELWPVLDPTIPPGTTGNVQARLEGAVEVGTGDAISTGQQTVPLLKVKEFLTGDTDLAIVISDEPNDTSPVVGDDPEGLYSAGDQFTYTIVATNQSSTTVANGVVVTTQLDPNLSFVSATVNGETVAATYDPATGSVEIDLFFLERVGDVGSNTATILLTVEVDGGAAPGTSLTTTTSIVSLTSEGNISDNTDSEQTVLAPNNVPNAIDDGATVSEDGPAATIDLTANDTDVDGDDLEIQSIDTTGTLGQVTVNPDNDTVVYDPNGAFEALDTGETALDTFTYTVTDGDETDTATVTVTITGANDGPDAIDDGATVAEDGPAATIDLTANDTDVDGDDLEIQSIDTTGTLGQVTVNPDNDTVVYDPNGAFEALDTGETALDTFTYTVTDGDETDTATVTVTITGANDGPDAIDDGATVAEDGPAATIDLTANDTDVDGDDLEIQSIDTAGTLGQVTVNPDNDTVVYDPNGAFEALDTGETALDTFTYTVTDGDETDTATVTVTITGANDGPDAIDDGATVSEDGPAATIDLTANDTDVDGDDLEIQSIDTTGTLGQVTVNPDNDTVVYDPNGAFEALDTGETALDTFTYTVTDGDETDTATVTVTITGANDGPDAIDDGATVSEDGPAATIDLTANDTDVDGDDLEIQSIDTTGTLGQVTVNPDNDTVVYDPNGAFEALDTGETALDTFTYTVTDGDETDTATVTVTITGANDGPDAIDDGATVSEDGPAATIDLTANDTDVDGDDLEIQSIDTTGTLGQVTVNPDNDTVVYDPNGAFEALDTGETALDTFTYTVTDGDETDTATVTVTITGANDGPDAIDDGATVSEDGPAATIDLTANDTDVDGDDLEIQSIDTTGTLGQVTVNPDNDTVVYDPNGAFEALDTGETALDTFTYTVTDGDETDTATVTVTITGANDGPDAIDDGATVSEDGPAATIDLTANDTDVDGDDLEIQSIDTTGTLGQVTVNPDNDTVVYDPNGAFEALDTGETALDTFTYTVTDGDETDTATVTVTITGANDGPDAIDDGATVSEDGPAATIDLTANDTDVDGDDLEIQSIDTTGTLGQVTVNPDNDTVVYDPNGAFEALDTGETALDTFTYTVTDGDETDTATVTVTITGANDGPDAIDDGATVAEDGPAATIDLTANDTDVDGDDLEIQSIDTTGTLGQVTVNPDNDTVVYDPNGAFEALDTGETALDTFTYTVTDGDETDTATVTVTITGANDGPDAIDDNISTASESTVQAVLTANDIDPDGDDLEIVSVDTTGLQGTVTVNADNDTVVYDPNGAFSALGQGETAIETFTYTITDGDETDTATVTVTIGGVNDPPTAVDDTNFTIRDRAVDTDVIANDSDPNNDPLTVTSATLLNANPAAVGTVTFAAGGVITFTPTTDFVGDAVIDYAISDGRGGSDTATLTVTVLPNQVPVIQEPVSFIVPENTPLAADLQGSDAESDPLTWSIVGGVDAGLFGIDASTGELSFLTAPDFELPSDANQDNDYVLRVRLADPYGFSERDILVTVTNVPDGEPTANDDIAFTLQNRAVTTNVLGNDDDPNNDPLTITNVTLVTSGAGTVNLEADQQITFTPERLFTGDVDISYTIDDGAGGTDTAILTVTVLPNTPPQISEPVSFSVDEGSLLAANLQGSDVNNDTLTWAIVGGVDANQFALDSATGQLNFQTIPDYDNPTDVGADNTYNVRVSLTDGLATVEDDILVTVLEVADPNVDPTFIIPTSADQGVIRLSAITQGNFSALFATDADSDTLQYQLFGEDADLFAIDLSSGSLSFSDPNATGGTLPSSFDGDRIYELDVLVTDGNGGSDVLDLELPLFLGG